MLTKYTAAEIMSRIMNLDMLLHATWGDIQMTRDDAAKIVKEAQEALQNYHNFLLIRERIPDQAMRVANIIGSDLFSKYVYEDDAEREYKRRANSVYGKTYDIDKEGSSK